MNRKIKRAFTLLVMVCVSLLAKADDYVLQLGNNILKGNVQANATFTPEIDCKVVVSTQEIFNVTYDGKSYEHGYFPGSDLAYVYEINDVKAGTVLSIKSDFIMSSETVINIAVYESGAVVPIKITDNEPEFDKVFPWNTSGNVTINFNREITISSISFLAGTFSTTVDDIRTDTSLFFNLSNALNEALKQGKIKPGEKFQIRIAGLRDAKDDKNLYNGNGRLILEFTAPYAQNNFVKATVGESELSYTSTNNYNFLSYYSPDNNDGLIVVEFSGAIKSVDDVYLTMGNLDLDASGKYHRSSIPFSIDGNKLFIDARGKLRTLAVLFPAVVETEPDENGSLNEDIGAYDTQHATISISNVIDTNGNAFLSSLPGSVGSFAFTMNYKEIIDNANIDGDNKYEGDDVKSGEEISLWLSNPDIKFDGIEVTYFVPEQSEDENSEVKQVQKMVVVSEYRTQKDEFEGEIIYFTMPEMQNVISGSTVRVALHNASSADGMPHYLYIEYKAVESATGISAIHKESKIRPVYRLNGQGTAEGNINNGFFIKDGKVIIKK